MKGVLVKFVVSLLIILIGTKVVIEFSAIPEPSFFWLISFFVFGVSTLSFIVLAWLGNNNPEGFIRIVLVSNVLKLITYIVFVATVIFLDGDNANANVLLFLSLYLIFTLLEIILIFKKMSAAN